MVVALVRTDAVRVLDVGSEANAVATVVIRDIFERDAQGDL